MGSIQSRYALRLLVASGLALAVLPAVVGAADPCPKGVQRLSKEGGDAEISWFSYATLAKVDDTDWCYHRKVVLHKPERQYVNWPKGEIHKREIVKEWTTRSCCYPEPRAEDGDLEHGYSAKPVATKVYRGSAEPKQNQTWVSMEGTLYVEPRIVRVDLTLKSSFRKTPDGYTYGYEITNLGDPVTVVWKSAESEFFAKALYAQKLSYPLMLGVKTRAIKASAFSSKPPDHKVQEVVLLTADGKEAIRVTAPAYVPR